MYERYATVKRVVDGDTLDLDIDMGLRIHAHERIRLNGIDTPETHRPKSDAERVHGHHAKAFVEAVAPVGTLVFIRTHKSGKYGRWLADVELVEATGPNVDLVELLKASGFEKRSDYQ